MWRFSLVALCLLLFADLPAEGAPIRVEFTGVVQMVDAQAPAGVFSIGDPVSGSFVYLSDAIDSNPNPDSGYYSAGVTSFDIEIGSYAGSASSTGLLAIDNDYCCGRDDSFIAQGLVTPTLGAPNARVSFSVIDHSRSALSSDAIPSALDLMTAFSLSDPNVQHDFNINWLSFGVGAVVRWDVDSISAMVVPEPNAASLLALGLIGIAAGRRQRGAA